MAGINPAVSTAILQHHERLDGSGYPYWLHGDKISILARIVSISDACASIFARFGNSKRMSIWMRLNSKKYDPELLSLLLEGFGPIIVDPIATNNVELTRLEAASQLFKHGMSFALYWVYQQLLLTIARLENWSLCLIVWQVYVQYFFNSASTQTVWSR